jgi:hypothetical protein
MLSGKVSGEGVRGVLLELESSHACGDLICTPFHDQQEASYTKTIKLWNGNFCLAKSGLSDDRLGELLYRNAVLNLDTFVSITDRVTSTARFGQLLVLEGLTTPIGLWEYLREQSRQILHSLLRYDRLKIEFKQANSSPEESYPLKRSLRIELEEASRSAHDLRRFLAEFSGLLKFEVHTAAESNLPDDFASEMQENLRQTPNFRHYIEHHSRASKERAMDDLFEAYTRGYIRTEVPFDRVRLAAGSASDIKSCVAWANDIIRRLQEHSSTVIAISDWEEIIHNARGYLTEGFGLGLCMTPHGHIDPVALCRSMSYRPDVGARVAAEARDLGIDPSLAYVRRRVSQCLLYILFELYNRRAGSAELRHVHHAVDAERARWS